jgi:hypothetical protein
MMNLETRSNPLHWNDQSNSERWITLERKPQLIRRQQTYKRLQNNNAKSRQMRHNSNQRIRHLKLINNAMMGKKTGINWLDELWARKLKAMRKSKTQSKNRPQSKSRKKSGHEPGRTRPNAQDVENI